MTRIMAASGPVSGPVSGRVSAVHALQAALAAEEAAIFGYGVAGAHLSGNRKAAAEQDWTGHNEARDTLAAMISALGAAPVPAQAFYQLPLRVHDAASATALAASATFSAISGPPAPCATACTKSAAIPANQLG